MMDRLIGKNVQLRPWRESDMDYFAELKNDLRTQAWSQRISPNTRPESMLERFKKSDKKERSAIFTIETLEGVLVGNINYSEWQPRLCAVLGIATGAEHWGKGYASEAQELLLNFLFRERGVTIVRLYTQSGNKGAIRAAEKLGFKISVRARQGCLIKEEVTDNLVMDMTREEFFALRNVEDPLNIYEALKEY